jgi:hypothetical protein
MKFQKFIHIIFVIQMLILPVYVAYKFSDWGELSLSCKQRYEEI